MPFHNRARTRYNNRWVNLETEEIRVSETRPGDGFEAMYATTRVNGSEYTPYEAKDGSPEWVRQANRNMADAARSNYERKNSR